MDEQNIDKFHESTFEMEEVTSPNEDKELSNVAEPKEVEDNTEKSSEETVDKTAEETTDENTEIVEKTEEDLSDVDNPKSYKHFQSIAEKRLIEIERERMKREILEEKIKQYEAEKTPPEPEIVKPVKPQMPSNYNKIDALTDPESDSFKYREAKEDYLEKLAEYNDTVQSRTQEEINQRKKLDEQAEFLAKKKAELLPVFQKFNPDPIEAQKDLEWTLSKESLQPEVFAEMVHLYRTRKNSPVQPKAAPAKPKAPLPPGVTEGEQEKEKDADDVFNETTFIKTKSRDI